MIKTAPVLILICLLISACSKKPFEGAWGAETLAKDKVVELQELYSNQDFKGIYLSGSDLFKTQHTQEEIEEIFKKVREELGSRKSTENIDWQVHASNRDNTYATVIQSSVFENKEAKESFKFLIQDDIALLESYEFEWITDEI